MVAKKVRAAAAEESHRSDHGEVNRAIDKLNEIQAELNKVDEKVNEKLTEVERKFKHIRDPVYARRNHIINNIPDFWSSMILDNPMLEKMLTKYDREILDYLDSLSVEDFPNPREGYCIIFTFKPNPYFRNRKVRKTITFSDDGTLRSVGTGVLWNRGQGPLGKRKDERNFHECSFCDWISSPPVVAHQDVFAEIIKEVIWANPIAHYDNVEDDYDDDSDDEDEEEENDDGKKDEALRCRRACNFISSVFVHDFEI